MRFFEYEAREAAERMGGLVRFADTPDEAARHAAAILALEIGGHMPRGVLVDPKAEVQQEYYAGVVWDGLRKRPVMIFSPVPDKVGRRHFSTRRSRPPACPAAGSLESLPSSPASPASSSSTT